MKNKKAIIFILFLIIFILIISNYSIFSAYKKFEKWNSQFDLKNYTWALVSYSWSINNYSTEEAIENYKITKEILDNIKEETKKQQEDKKQEDKNQDWNTNKDENWNLDKNSEWWEWEKEKSSSDEATKKRTEKKLTTEEIKQIDSYLDDLKQEEQYNRQFYNNANWVNNDPFFDDLFDRGEKDW